MPVIGDDAWLRMALTSVLRDQTLQVDTEVLVVNEKIATRPGMPPGVPDDALRETFADEIAHGRLLFLPWNPGEAGAALARNRGVAAARGQYIAMCDAADEWEAGYLENALPTARKTGIVFTRTDCTDARGDVVRHARPLPEASPQGGRRADGNGSRGGIIGNIDVLAYGGGLASFRPIVRRDLDIPYFPLFAEDVLHDLTLLARHQGQCAFAQDAVYRLRVWPGRASVTTRDEEAVILEQYRDVVRGILWQPSDIGGELVDLSRRQDIAQAMAFRAYVSRLYRASMRDNPGGTGAGYDAFVAGREYALWQAFSAGSVAPSAAG